MRPIARDGTTFDLEAVSYDGETHVAGGLGQARFDIDPSRVSSLIVGESESGGRCVASVLAIDGTEVQVEVDGSIEVAGTGPLGVVRIALRDVSSVSAR